MPEITQKKKKILYVITKSNWGGAQKYVYELATNLPKDKFETLVVLGGNGTLARNLSQAGIQVVNLEKLDKNINILKEFSVLIDLIKIFKKERPDIVHLNSSKIGGLGALAGRLTGIPKIIFTAHGFAHNEDRPLIIKTLMLAASYATILLAHKTVVINKRELDQVSRLLPLIDKKLKLIYIGAAPTDFIRMPKEAGSPITIGTISELTKNKGLEYAIEAVARLKNRNINFIIIGEGEERGHLESIIKEKHLEDTVQLLGFKENARNFLGMFDIFTLTSLKEGLPYAILEAGLAGLPAIASDVGGISEIIENGKSGILVQPKNVEQLVDALSGLIDQPEKRRPLGESLRKNIINNFSVHEMLDKTMELYNS